MTTVELKAWTRFLDASRLVEELLAAHLTRNHAMNHSEYEVLVRLDGAGGSMRMSELARLVVASRPKLSYTVDQLERRGWVRRLPVATDGRGVEAVLTGPGRDALADAAIGHAELIRSSLLDRLTESEIEMIGEAMDRVSRGIRSGS